jgi:hypothetical protein
LQIHSGATFAKICNAVACLQTYADNVLERGVRVVEDLDRHARFAVRTVFARNHTKLRTAALMIAVRLKLARGADEAFTARLDRIQITRFSRPGVVSSFGFAEGVGFRVYADLSAGAAGQIGGVAVWRSLAIVVTSVAAVANLAGVDDPVAAADDHTLAPQASHPVGAIHCDLA